SGKISSIVRAAASFASPWRNQVSPMTTLALTHGRFRRARQFFALTKPRVVSLIVFTAVIGMFVAAAAINCLVEQKIDAMMARTRTRPLPRGEISSMQTLIFACAIGAIGLGI